jgi:isoleucyl-tRNA synthetase
LLAVSTILGLKSPYKNVISLAHVLDKKGEKMSKSKGNVVDPWEIINKYSSDALRWYFYTVNQPGDYKRFDESDLQKTQRKFISTLSNTLIFYKTYSEDKYTTYNIQHTTCLDTWILSRLNSLIGEITAKLNAYDITGAARVIENFVIDDFSNWYVRRSRKRFQNPKTPQEKKEAEQILGYVLLETSKLCAPFVPFLSEHIFQELNAKRYTLNARSIHWQDFPRVNKEYVNSNLEKEMSDARKIVEIVHEQRASAGIRVRQPLGILEINTELPDEIKKIIADEVNVKEIRRGAKIALDTKLSPKLKEEGFINEFMRHVQDLRKSGGFVPKDKIMLSYSVGSDLSKSIYKWKDTVIKQSNASDIVEAKDKKEVFKAQSEFEWEGNKIWIGIKKISAQGGSASGGKKL